MYLQQNGTKERKRKSQIDARSRVHRPLQFTHLFATKLVTVATTHPVPKKSKSIAPRMTRSKCITPDTPNVMEYASADTDTMTLRITTNAGSSLAHWSLIFLRICVAL